MLTHDKRFSLENEKEFRHNLFLYISKKASFDSVNKQKFDNFQRNRGIRSKSRSEKNGSSKSRSRSGKRDFLIHKKYEKGYRKDYFNERREPLVASDDSHERKDHYNERKEHNYREENHKKFNNFERKKYNFVRNEPEIVRREKIEEKEKGKRKFSSFSSESAKKTVSEISQTITNFSQPVESSVDDMYKRSCYFLGVPSNVQGNHIYQELQKRRIDYPDKFDIIKKSKNKLKEDDNSHEYIYYSLIFREKRFVDTLLEEGFDVLNNPVLVLPSLPDVKYLVLSYRNLLKKWYYIIKSLFFLLIITWAV